MAASQKAVSIARQLAEDLGLRTGLTITSGVDASGNPQIQIGTGVAGTQSAFLRVTQETTLQTDPVLGSAARVYTPHVIQLAVEESATSGLQKLTGINFAKILTDCTKFGTKVEVYYSANTVAATVSTIAAGNLKVTLASDLWHPLTSQI